MTHGAVHFVTRAEEFQDVVLRGNTTQDLDCSDLYVLLKMQQYEKLREGRTSAWHFFS